ncbi:MAG: hypothetical protein LBC62_07695 [Treponema sp.]|nr:hypothetical protein [Treponema sp.]
MATMPTGSAQYLARFSEQSIACSQYALSKLGLDRSHCFLKIEEYVILCVPFQLGFKRSVFLASLSKQELTFFQRYVNGIVGLSIALNPDSRPEPVKFFVRCSLTTIGQMKGRENVGLFVVDYKATPDEMVVMLGGFLETQDRIKTQFEDYGKRAIKITPEVAKIMGYNMYATVMEPNQEARRIQIFSISSKTVEHLEAAKAPARPPGTAVAYQFFFKKFRVSAAGTVVESAVLPQGIVRTMASLDFSPELVEILDDYWYACRANPSMALKR